MRKWKEIFVVGVLAVVLCTGCGTRDRDKMIQNHKAEEMQEEGVWEQRYIRSTDSLYGEGDTLVLFVNVYKDMSEDDMLDVLDYYKLCMHSESDDTGAYVGERDTTFTCYAVFYREKTDEELKRFKCVDGEIVEITEEDEAQFAGPEERN